MDLFEGNALPGNFYRRPADLLAPLLLNKLLATADGRVGRIVEVEAYAGDDPASHAFRGRTARNAAMFGPAGHLYVYFTYGMHWCANAVCGQEGEGTAVLLRALEPLAGQERMRQARPRARSERDLCSGPAKLAQALGITGTLDGVDLASGAVRILGDGVPPPGDPVVTPRIGITKATELPWRWYVPGNPHVSRP
ncbi:DNA-3-methyladenine glycosylase [Lysobacter sp. GX 14042]|uniref:DNA-3-methyladenine glycosylase n=1 Tax=Lysobacter sp. GX 14042 TaxID=2907155 RepID=UPI001F36AFD6|nr:DNA-3-methyladenine glycosylase [Lysobacter sp. GX 14042]MCE7031351.1 DNA-3-methyladenine glycosylase [Lysobacter sp. GX 14042]